MAEIKQVNAYLLSELLGKEAIVSVLQNASALANVDIVLQEHNGELLSAAGEVDNLTGYYQQRVTLPRCLPLALYVRLSTFASQPAGSISHLEHAQIVCANVRDLLECMLKTKQSNVEEFDIEAPLRLREVLDASPTPMGWSNVDTGVIEYINPAFEKLFGYSHSEIPTLQAWFHKAFPDETYREQVLMPWHSEHLRNRQPKDMADSRHVEVTCKDHSVRHVQLSATWVGGRRLVNYTDVTAYWQVQSRLQAHGEMLEMVATGLPLQEILKAIIKQVQKESKDALASVLLLDADNRLRNCVAPDLPQFYLDAIDGVQAAPATGACGTAAYLKQRVITENISEHRYWRGYTDLADQAGLAACWSDPILSSRGDVLGTFAIYHPYPTSPSAEDIELIGFASNLASVAIENRQSLEALERQAYFDSLTGLATRGFFLNYAERVLQELEQSNEYYSMIMLDVDHFKSVNDLYGHKVGDEVLKHVAKVMANVTQESGLVGRIGGEEFAIMLPKANKQDALKIADIIRVEVSQAAVLLADGQHIKVTLSAGVAQCCEQAEEAINIDRLFARADAALYQAKESGRNLVVAHGMACK